MRKEVICGFFFFFFLQGICSDSSMQWKFPDDMPGDSSGIILLLGFCWCFGRSGRACFTQMKTVGDWTGRLGRTPHTIRLRRRHLRQAGRELRGWRKSHTVFKCGERLKQRMINWRGDILFLSRCFNSGKRPLRVLGFWSYDNENLFVSGRGTSVDRKEYYHMFPL